MASEKKLDSANSAKRLGSDHLNPNLHVAITHAWNVFSQHLFGLENEWSAWNTI